MVYELGHSKYVACISETTAAVPPGKVFMATYADYIVHKNTKLGSAGQLESLRKMLKKGR